MQFSIAGVIAWYILLLFIFEEVKICNGYIFPGNSAYGIFAAIAVPLNLPHQNVFFSYNFEANYNLPGDAQTIIPGPYKRFDSDEEDVNEAIAETEAGEGTESADVLQEKTVAKSFNNKPLITRQSIYDLLRNKLNASGLNGEACIFKLICEINSSMLGKTNGVIGSILHILLSPSTSVNEKMSSKLYKAEETGRKGYCNLYENECNASIIDIISSTADNILK